MSWATQERIDIAWLYDDTDQMNIKRAHIYWIFAGLAGLLGFALFVLFLHASGMEGKQAELAWMMGSGSFFALCSAIIMFLAGWKVRHDLD